VKLDDRITELVVVGPSAAASCQSCSEYHVGEAMNTGVGTQEIADAVQVGKMVRKGAAAKMDQPTSSLIQVASSTAGASNEGCGCGS